MTTYGIAYSAASVKLAKELTNIATNVEFGVLRSDMVTSRIVQETEGVGVYPAGTVEFIARLMGALEMVLLTVEVLADDIAETAANMTKAQQVADDPRFKDQLEAMARELADSREGKPLRRLAIVDESFREMEP